MKFILKATPTKTNRIFDKPEYVTCSIPGFYDWTWRRQHAALLTVEDVSSLEWVKRGLPSWPTPAAHQFWIHEFIMVQDTARQELIDFQPA